VILGVAELLAMVPPHPGYAKIPAGYQPTRIELRTEQPAGTLVRPRTVPNDILVLRVQFSDLSFQSTPAYPDYLAHDTAFFERWMLHLTDFFSDASHNSYALRHYLYPDVVTMNRSMAYYGGDNADTTDVRVSQLAADLVNQLDGEIDFSQYGGIIIFHAGAGQESDISGVNTDQIWSTFLTRKALQASFDPDNDDYPGLPTADGVALTNLVIVPESEFQDYFPGEGEDNAEAYLFSIYGVLCHQFGHLIGLPTLFDNDSSNGRSQGIGNWGLMGTGVWNASGYVPAQLCAWSRWFLGWEDAVTLTEDTDNVPVDDFLDHFPGRQRLYKIPISDSEYFLIENRQQNPDGSLDPYSNLPSYTFKLLPEGEQDYYENYPLLPYFNFMENRYAGCEWDFFLPGLGGPIPPNSQIPVEGSGLLIWHIDENVIAENFTANFDLNRVNGYAPHKGVDLEEADGTQNLDTATANTYKYGSPYDSFRLGNNDYLGNEIHNNMLSLPTSESYYGGVPLEIFDISASGNQMTFSVRFGWRLDADYEGENPVNASIVDFDGGGDSEIFYPMPDGRLYLWKNEFLAEGYPLQLLPVVQDYVYAGGKFYLPMQQLSNCFLYGRGPDSGSYVQTWIGWDWATHPIGVGNKVYSILNNELTGNGSVYEYDLTANIGHLLYDLEAPVVSNPVYFKDHLYLLGQNDIQEYRLWDLDLLLGEKTARDWPLPPDSLLVGIFKAPLLPGGQDGEFIAQFRNSVYVYGNDLQPVAGFPFVHDLNTTAPLTLGDFDRNGRLEIILNSAEGIAVIDYSGTLASPPGLMGPSADSLGFSSGLLTVDLDDDGRMELLGSFSNNRLLVWEDSFRLKTGFPVSFQEPSRNLPLIGKASDGITYAWTAADNGLIFRQALPGADLNEMGDYWYTEYANLQRHASFDSAGLDNEYLTDDLFVPGEVYIYPNPLKSIYAQNLTLNLMTSRDTDFELKIFDIKGRLVYRQKAFAKAYLRNRQLIDLPEAKLASGVYIAVVCADTRSKRIKFAIEK
jgi:M6 family metalloprotease-like protein